MYLSISIVALTVLLFSQDFSGTMNSFEEASHMSTNLCFVFKYDIVSEEVQPFRNNAHASQFVDTLFLLFQISMRISSLDVENSPMNFEEFWEWFQCTFSDLNTNMH